MARKESDHRGHRRRHVRDRDRKNPVRLANVAALEKGEPGAGKTTEALQNLIQGEGVLIDTVARDQYGRSVANVKMAA
ncbi:MAG: hypothetical protein AB1671_05565 [Thermodesulfobacteriota bacterium]|jgi:endonuclease YncB( thermonuclease family)